MVRRSIHGALMLSTLLTAWGLMSQEAGAQVRTSAPGDLFYNYYVPPAGYSGVGAELYPAPRPTPPRVGHTYITYQPFMPHEFLYEHHRGYWARNPDGGVTHTSVTWLRCPQLWPLRPSLGWSHPVLPHAPVAIPSTGLRP